MGLRLLGPLDLFVGDRSLRIGGPRERVMLAMLALKANRVTSVEQLVDAVWDDDPPPSARSQIQACISGLRKLLRDSGLAAQIQTHPSGYLLAVPPDELDSEEFTTQVAAARAQAEAGRLTE